MNEYLDDAQNKDHGQPEVFPNMPPHQLGRETASERGCECHSDQRVQSCLLTTDVVTELSDE